MGERKKSEFRFVNDTRVNAERFPDEVWERHKEAIQGRYLTHKLEDVMEYMTERYDFTPTKRQYIHRLEKWGIKKYNKGKKGDEGDDDEHNQGDSAAHSAVSRRKKPRQPQLSHRSTFAGSSQQPFSDQGAPAAAPQGQYPNPYDDQSQVIDPYLLNDGDPGAHLWYSLLANSHYAMGDSQSAFQIQAALYQRNSEESLAVTCARSAQVKKQVNEVRIIIEEAINRSKADENSWDRFLFSAQLARNWEQTGDSDNAFEQFGDLLERFIDLSNSQFKQRLGLRQRSPGNPPYKFDILAYIYLRHAVISFNKDDLNIEAGLWLDEDKILQQFRKQQPFSNGVRVSCLEECLEWCVEHLAKNNTLLEKREPLPINLETIPSGSIYKVVCLLWSAWVKGLQQPQPDFPPWSTQAEDQLSISAAELLVLVVCTIMAKPLLNRRGKFDSAVGDALFRASILKLESSSEDLLDLFLIQVEKTTDQRMAATEAPVKACDFDAVREVISGSMPARYTLPSRHHGYIHPLMARGQDESEAAYIHPLIVRGQDESGAAVPTPSTTFLPFPSPSLYSPFVEAQFGAGY